MCHFLFTTLDTLSPQDAINYIQRPTMWVFVLLALRCDCVHTTEFVRLRTLRTFIVTVTSQNLQCDCCLIVYIELGFGKAMEEEWECEEMVETPVKYLVKRARSERQFGWQSDVKITMVGKKRVKRCWWGQVVTMSSVGGWSSVELTVECSAKASWRQMKALRWLMAWNGTTTRRGMLRRRWLTDGCCLVAWQKGKGTTLKME